MYNKNQALKYGGIKSKVVSWKLFVGCVCIKGVAEPSHRPRQFKRTVPNGLSRVIVLTSKLAWECKPAVVAIERGAVQSRVGSHRAEERISYVFSSETHAIPVNPLPADSHRDHYNMASPVVNQPDPLRSSCWHPYTKVVLVVVTQLQ
jgi:hypothetical protein